MAGILNRVKMLGRPPAAVEAEDAAMVLPVDRQKKAIRNWRVVLDKIATILVMAALQEATGEWLPVSSPSGSSTEGIGDTPEDCFAEIIKIGKPLAPLKSKTKVATMAVSDCVHPKGMLAMGGNAAMSYVLCKMCHGRWESPFRAKDVRVEYKKGGSLSHKSIQDVPMVQEPMQSRASAAIGATPKSKSRFDISAVEEIQRENLQNQETMNMVYQTQLMVDQMARNQQASSSQSAFQMEEMQQMSQEMRQMMQHMREKATQQEALVTMMANQVQKGRSQRSPSPLREVMSETFSDAVPASHVSVRSKQVKCLCGVPAEKLTVKKEGPRQGRHFWKCVQRNCQFFEWVPIEKNTPEQQSRRKSPRRSVVSGPTSQSWTQVVEIDLDGQL